MVGLIIKDVDGLNDNGGIRWYFKYKGKVNIVVFKFTVLFITGDTEGHDKIAAHCLSRTNVICPCRICDVPFDGLGDPHEDSWSLTKQSDIEKLLERDDRDALKEMSHQPVKVAFHSGLFHGCQYGLNGNTLPGYLHILAHGNFPRVKHGLFTSKKLNNRQAVVDSDGEEEPISAPSNGLSGLSERSLLLRVAQMQPL